MQLADYITVLRRRWWIILLTGFVAAVAAYAFSKLQAPVYRAEAYYTVSSSRLDAGLSQVMQSSMTNIRDSALAPVQLDKISNQLKLDRSADWLLNDVVSMQSLPADLKMIVRVDYPNEPATAVRLANAIGENMVAIQTTKNAQIDGTDKINVTVLNPARDLGIVKPNTKINVAAGLLLGLILGLLLAFLLESLDNSLKSIQDVERYVGLPTLGAIPTIGSSRRSLARRQTADERRLMRKA